MQGPLGYFAKADELFTDALSDWVNKKPSLTYGIDVLDFVTKGINTSEFVVLGAVPKAGKTELALHTVAANLMAGKRVTAFILEGGRNDVWRRMAFKRIVELTNGELPPNWGYVDFVNGIHPFEGFVKLLQQATDDVKVFAKNLRLFDHQMVISASTLPGLLGSLDGHTDLVIIDNLQCLAGQQDNTFTDQVMGTIDKMVSLLGIPIVLIAHLRKPGMGGTGFPTFYDFKGSGSISQKAHTAILMAPADALNPDPKFSWTLFKVDASRYGARTGDLYAKQFNKQTLRYTDGFRKAIIVWNKDTQRKELQFLNV